MQAASRITGWFALAMVVTGCGASDVVRPQRGRVGKQSIL